MPGFIKDFRRGESWHNACTGSVNAAFTEGSSDLFVPYAAYAGTLDFGTGLAQWNDTLNSVFAGFTSGFGADGRRIAFRDATNPGDWSVSVDAAAGYRFANPSAFANYFAVAPVDVLYNVSSDLRLGITPTIRGRDYADYFGAPRHDLRVGFLARAEWTPAWLSRLNPEAELDFTVSFLRNHSTLSSASYRQWGAVPPGARLAVPRTGWGHAAAVGLSGRRDDRPAGRLPLTRVRQKVVAIGELEQRCGHRHRSRAPGHAAVFGGLCPKFGNGPVGRGDQPFHNMGILEKFLY